MYKCRTRKMDRIDGRRWLYAALVLLLVSSAIYIVAAVIGPSGSLNNLSKKEIVGVSVDDTQRNGKSVQMKQASLFMENIIRKIKTIPYLFAVLKCSSTKHSIYPDMTVTEEKDMQNSFSVIDDGEYTYHLPPEEQKNKFRQETQNVTLGQRNVTTEGRSKVVRPPRVKRDTDCKQGKNCLLPKCKCRDNEKFLKSFKRKDIPQIIYIAIDDAFQTRFDEPYKYMFWEHKNPNGCPLTGSMYVINKDTNYTLVKEYYERGWEMGAHGINHSYIQTEEELKFESPIQRANLVKNGIKEKDVRGWRSPYLVNAGSNLPPILQNAGYTYDISHHMDEKWPFTLDYEPQDYEYSEFARTPGFWIVPLNGLYVNGEEMWDPFVDRTIDDMTPRQITNLLWNNFRRKYKGDRTPFGLHTHGEIYAENLIYPKGVKKLYYAKGIRNFFRRLSRRKLKDVYVISVWQMLQWVQRPTKMSGIHKFKPWVLLKIT